VTSLRLGGSAFTEPLPKSGLHNPLFCCWFVYYLETAVSVAQQFLHAENTPQYYFLGRPATCFHARILLGFFYPEG
jgi:hypothetical protein